VETAASVEPVEQRILPVTVEPVEPVEQRQQTLERALQLVESAEMAEP
jgi:hypothetical protein